MTIRLALVTDRHDWAFDTNARALAAVIGPDYAVDVICGADYSPRVALCKDLFLDRQYDIIHFFWSVDAQLAISEAALKYLKSYGLSLCDWVDRFSRQVVSASVQSHRYLSPDGRQLFAPLFNAVNGYTVGSRILYEHYEAMPWAPLPTIIGDGVDLNLFTPAPPPPKAPHEPMIVGWAGNSAFNPGEDLKGLHTIIRPAIDSLRAKGFPIQLQITDQADSLSGPTPHDAMPDFYRQLDVYVCASIYEGTPLPTLEAMATGLPVVTTRVGVAPEAFGPLQQEFILPERSPEALKAALLRLWESPSHRQALSQENLAYIQPWSWPNRSALWREYFTRLLTTNDPQTHRRKAYALMRHYNAFIHGDWQAALRYFQTAGALIGIKARRRFAKLGEKYRR